MNEFTSPTDPTLGLVCLCTAMADNRRTQPSHPPDLEAFRQALVDRDPEKIEALIALGVDLHYVREGGYGAVLDAVHGPDERLIDVLRLLISHGVDPDPISKYGESGLRVLSRQGRFDAVQVLLDA